MNTSNTKNTKNTVIQPASIAAPAAKYALAVGIPAGSELVLTSGIVGERPDGTISEDIGEQAVEMWRSIDALLTAGGLSKTDVVAYTTYAVAGHDLSAVMAARDAYFDGHLATSTLVPVPMLARPHWFVEVTVTAARTPR
jgi:2-iminobutanoate/2-iminopropanoate deaminase